MAALLGRAGFDDIRRNDGFLRHRHSGLFSDLLADPPDAGMMTLDDSPDGVTQIAQQVPPIGYLDGPWRTLANAVSVCTGAIARHNFDTRVFAKPGRQCLGLSIRQQIHDLIALQINQDGSIAIAATPALRWLSNGCAVGTFASFAQSSTARIRGDDWTLGLDDPAEVAIRSSVSALTGAAIRTASRHPASPPSARPK